MWPGHLVDDFSSFEGVSRFAFRSNGSDFFLILCFLFVEFDVAFCVFLIEWFFCFDDDSAVERVRCRTSPLSDESAQRPWPWPMPPAEVLSQALTSLPAEDSTSRARPLPAEGSAAGREVCSLVARAIARMGYWPRKERLPVRATGHSFSCCSRSATTRPEGRWSPGGEERLPARATGPGFCCCSPGGEVFTMLEPAARRKGDKKLTSCLRAARCLEKEDGRCSRGVLTCLPLSSSSNDGKLRCGYSSFKGKRATIEDFYDITMSKVDGQTVCLFGIFD
ncbi:hypothetical protein Dimus_005892, partial [Dionaea muscipula]